MSFNNVIRILRARRLIILLCTIGGAALATTTVQLATPVYEATSSVYFSLPSATSGNDLSQGANYTQAQMLSYAALIDQPIVLQPVIDDLGLAVTTTQLARQVTATASSDTVLLIVTVADPSPIRAAAIANRISNQLIATSSSLSPRTQGGADAAIKGTVVAVATPPRLPSSPNKRRDVAAGLLAGLILGGVAALLRERTDTRLRTPNDIATLTAVPVIGEVGASTGPPQLGAQSVRAGREAEAFRKIRTNVEFMTLDAPTKTLLVTSALSGEGKSTTCIRLAASLAEAGWRVLLVDADLRRPSVAAYIGLEPSVGLTTALMGRATLEELVQTTPQPSLFVLASGTIPPNPAELLGSASMRELLSTMTELYDVVVFDSPPLLAVTDAAVLSKLVASTIVVANCSQVRRPELVEALATLEQIDASVIGVIANKVSDDNAMAYEAYPSMADSHRATGSSFTLAWRLLKRRSS